MADSFEHAQRHAQLLERIERQLQRLDEKLTELEEKLPELPTVPQPETPVRRRRKPR